MEFKRMHKQFHRFWFRKMSTIYAVWSHPSRSFMCATPVIRKEAYLRFSFWCIESELIPNRWEHSWKFHIELFTSFSDSRHSHRRCARTESARINSISIKEKHTQFVLDRLVTSFNVQRGDFMGKQCNNTTNESILMKINNIKNLSAIKVVFYLAFLLISPFILLLFFFLDFL